MKLKIKESNELIKLNNKRKKIETYNILEEINLIEN